MAQQSKKQPKSAQKSVKKKSAKKKVGSTKIKSNLKKSTKPNHKPVNNKKTPRKVVNTMTTTTKKTAQFDKITKDAAAASQESVDIWMKSGSIFAKGCEDFVKTYVSLAQGTAEKNSEAMKTLFGCKTLNEFTEAQQKLAQANFDELVSGATKLSELSVKVATEAFEPINDQFSKSIKQVTDTIAA